MKTVRRRRQEGKTDYRARLALLVSEKPRLIVRKTNRYVIAQIVKTDIAQDKVIVGVTSKVLLSKGWPSDLSGSLKSLGAAYLTGFILGKESIEKGVKGAILDMGMHPHVANSRIYALLKGAVDAGLDVPHSDKVLPKMENIKTDKIAKIFDKIAGGKD